VFFSGCAKGKCTFCTHGTYLKLCVTGAYLPDKIGFELLVTVGGHQVYRKEISVVNPPPICFNKLPVAREITDVCVELYQISLKQKSACVRVTLKILRKKINVKLACFKIPFAVEESSQTENDALGDVLVY